MWGWVAYCFRNYAVFKGRASRPEYWWFYLFVFLVSIAVNVLAVEAPGLRFALGILLAFTIVPHLAVASRRLHDTGHSFWWLVAPALAFVPIMVVALNRAAGKGNPIGAPVLAVFLLAFLGLAIWVLILFCREGDAGPNRYGDPAPTIPA